VALARLQESFEETQRAWAGHFDQIQEPAHQSQETPWLKRTGFAEHLRGMDKTALLRATGPPGRGGGGEATAGDASHSEESDGAASREPAPGAGGGRAGAMVVAAGHLTTLLRKAHAAACQSGPSARLNTPHARVLNSLEGQRTQSEPFRQLQDPRSLRRYTDDWARFLAYVWRLTEPSTTGALGALVRPTARQRQHLTRLQEAARAEVDDDEDEEDEDEEDEDEGAGEGRGWLSRMEVLALEASMAFVQQPLHESPYASALLSYVAARALKRDGSWKAPSYMTSFLAGITYDIQLLLFAQARWAADQAGGEGFGTRLRQGCQRWLANDRATPSAEILSWRLYARKVASATLPTAYTSWSQDGETVTYRDSVLTMAEWRALIRGQVERAERLLRGPLLLGQEKAPRPRARHLLDVETETRPGYSFTQDPRNGMGTHGRWLLELLLREPGLAGNPMEVRGGAVVWRAGRVQDYLRQVTAFLEHLLLAMHLTGGLPGRAPEMLSLRHCNDEQPRNVMVHDGQVMFITGYHKMQYAAGSRLVCRFLPAAVGDLLVTYLAVVLPFARHLERLQGRPTGGAFLFAQGPAPWKEHRLTEVMRRESRATLGLGLTVAAYRHLAIAIDRRHLRGMGAQSMGLREDGEPPGAGERAEDHVNDLQASHSTLTSNQSYANSVRTGRMFNDPKLNQFWDTSRQWHALAQVVEAKAEGATATSAGKGKRGRTDSMRGSVDRPGPPAAPGWTTAVPTRAGPARARRARTDEEVDAALRQIHGPAALPRSEGQWDALTRVVEGIGQLVVVLPTGGGKSLLFQLPSVLEGAGVTVVIVPLVVLRQDLAAKCRRLGLSHTVWGADMEADSRCAPLLLVGVEEACGGGFVGLLQRLSMEGRLDRICLDEAHLVLTDAGYRESLRQVRQVRRVPVPFLALTATLPPVLEPALATALFLDRPLTIRRSVDRPDLAYVVLAMEDILSGADEMTLVDGAAQLITNRPLLRPGEDDRLLCYVSTRAQAEDLAAKTGCAAYHAGVEDRAAVYEGWLAGRPKVLVGTSAIGSGADFPRVRLVLHVGEPRGAMAFSQESGRAGRDGRGATSAVLVRRAQTDPQREEPSLDADRRTMRRMLCRTVPCRRQVLTAYLDGGDGVHCSNLVEGSACDRCLAPPEALAHGHGDGGEDGPGWAVEDPSDPADDVLAGGRLARASTKEEEAGRARYREGLVWWASRCVGCLLAGGEAGAEVGDWRHEPCAMAPGEAAMFKSSRKRLRYGPGIGCFHCGNPEWLCDSQGRREACRWGTTTLRLCFASHGVRGHPGLQALRERLLPRAALVRPGELFDWLGRAARLHGAAAFNANVLVDGMLAVLPGHGR
jgi:hypothetical protein